MTAKPDRDEERVGGMTMEDRVEAAVRAQVREDWMGTDEEFAVGYPDDWVPAYLDELRHEVRGTLRAAFPELFSEPPSAWLAPWEASPQIIVEIVGEGGWAHATETDVRDVWRTARDAHLNPNRSEGEGK